MDSLIINNISLIIFLPLWIFLVIMVGRFFCLYINKKIIHILTLLSSVTGIAVCALAIKYITEPVEWSSQFIHINNFVLSYGLYIDKLSLFLGLALFIVSASVQLFSVSYTKNKRKNYRFFALLNLFNFGMSALLFSQNLFQLYFFWEIIGIASYLLIGFDYTKITKSISAMRVFLINRIGDTALIGGILLVANVMFNYSANINFTTLSISDLDRISAIFMAYTTTPAFLIICGLFILASIVKSAQFPFHIWLQDAMEAELPVSALLHSSTMVVAGVYLAIRLLPFYTLYPILLTIIVIIGLVSGAVCSIFASIEIHPKKILAYSTSANIGLMFFALAHGKLAAAMIYLAVHALTKSMLFLSLPYENKTITKYKYITFIVGSLILAGFILTGIQIKGILYSFAQNNDIIRIIFLFIIFMTSYYLIRLCLIIRNNSEFVKEKQKLENFSITSLILLNIVLSIILKTEHKIGIAFIFAFMGLLIAIIIYKFYGCKNNYLPYFTEKLAYSVIPTIYSKISDFTYVVEKKIFENYKPTINFARYSIKLTNWIEENIMNKSIKYTSCAVKALSKWDLFMQNGNIQTYNAYAFILVTIVITCVIIGYAFIITHAGG